MKKIMSLILAFLLMFMLSACSSGNQEIGDTQEQEEVSNGNSQIEISNESEESEIEESEIEESETEESETEENSNWSLSIPYLPIASMKDTFIVQDESTSYYGLIDSEGNEILSCDYRDMEYLIVNTSNPKYYVKVQEKGSYGVYDLSGQLIVSPSYDSISAGNYIDAFDAQSNGNSVYIDLDGNEVDYDSMTDWPSVSVTSKYGNPTIPPYYFCISSDDQLYVINLENGETLLNVPVSGNWSYSSEGEVKDTETENLQILFGDRYYITIDENGAHYIDMNESNIYKSVGVRYYKGLSFYNGTSFAFTTDDRLIVVDVDGNIVRELDNNFSDKDRCYLLADCAILNNNGYIYVIDKEGNTICDEEGYTGVSLVNGAIVLTTAEGYKEVIDTYGNFVITRDSNTIEWDYEELDDGYIIYRDGDNNYHICNEYIFEEYAVFSDEFVNNLAKGQGGVITNEEQTKIYVFASVNGQYEIRLISTSFRAFL